MTLVRQRILGQDIHPLYRNILQRAIGLGYVLPSITCQRLQNILVKALYDTGVWSRLLFFYNLLNDSSDVDFCRIDWITPSRTPATGSPTFAPSGGVGSGYLSSIWSYAEFVTTKGFTFQNGSFYCYVRTGGTNTVGSSIGQVQGSTNLRLIQLLSRLSPGPRQDGYFCVPAAAPSNIQAGNLPSNTGYSITQLSAAATTWINGVNTGIPATGNLEPDNGTINMGSGEAGRTCGCWGVALSLTAQQEADLNTAFRTNYALVL